MEIIVCLDDNNGMLFNGRRQSRDKEVIADIVNSSEGKKIFISPFSKTLFEACDRVIIDENFLEKAEDDICFIENRSVGDFISKINKITVYNWNRIYPSDFKCDIDFSEFSLADESEFKGNSHEKITKRIYIKG